MSCGKRAHAVRESTGQRTQRTSRGRFGSARDQIGDRLGLSQVHLPVQKRSLGELTRPRESRTETQTSPEQHVHDHRTAMPVKFGDVLAGERMRRGECERDSFIDRLTRGVAKPRNVEVRGRDFPTAHVATESAERSARRCGRSRCHPAPAALQRPRSYRARDCCRRDQDLAALFAPPSIWRVMNHCCASDSRLLTSQ